MKEATAITLAASLVVVLAIFGLVHPQPTVAQSKGRFEVGSTYNFVWTCLPSGVASLVDYMIKTAGGPDDTPTLCREEILTVIAVGSDGLLDVYDQREKDAIDKAAEAHPGTKRKPRTWVVNPAVAQSWSRIVPEAERQASR